MTSRVQDRRRFHPDGTLREGELPTDRAAPGGEDAAPAAVGEDPEVAQLRADLDTARRRVDELARGIQDVMKDRDDFKARVNRERERLLEVEKGQVLQALIETVDELDLSLQSPADDSPLAQGVRLIRDKLLQRLQAAGVERLRLLGRPYDPNLAEAVDMELVSSPAQNDVVLEEQRAAYGLRGRVIRPGRVKVGKYLAPAKA